MEALHQLVSVCSSYEVPILQPSSTLVVCEGKSEAIYYCKWMIRDRNLLRPRAYCC